MLYHLRNRRRPHSSSGLTAGRRELLEDGHRRRFRRGRRTFRGTTGRTEQRADLSRERTTQLRERADDRDSELDYLLRPTMHGPGGTLLIIVHSFLERRSLKNQLSPT